MKNVRKSFYAYNSLFFFAMFVLLSCNYSREYHQATPENRVTIVINDTIFQFQLLPREKKLKIVTSDNLFYTWYSSNKIQITRGAFSGRLLDGFYIEQYPNRQLKVKGMYYKGLKTGVWKSWQSTGELSAVYEWEEGLLNGPFMIFNHKGAVISKGSYKEGIEIREIANAFSDSTVLSK